MAPNIRPVWKERLVCRVRGRVCPGDWSYPRLYRIAPVSRRSTRQRGRGTGVGSRADPGLLDLRGGDPSLSGLRRLACRMWSRSGVDDGRLPTEVGGLTVSLAYINTDGALSL